MSARPTYGTAIMWLIANESLAWIDDPAMVVPDAVRAIADLFEVPIDQLRKDLRVTLNSAHARRK